MSHHIHWPRAAVCCAIALLVQSVQAADYYVDSAAAAGGNGSQTSPWKTLAQVNGATQLTPGNRVLFKRGGEWQGTLTVKNGVTYEAYPEPSSLPRPVIRASKPVGNLSWKIHKNRIYVADMTGLTLAGNDVDNVAHPAAVTQLMLGTARLQRARTPNIGAGVFGVGQNRFARVLSGSGPIAGTTSQALVHEAAAIPSTLPATDLVGAQAMVKNASWAMSRYNVTSADRNAARLVLAPDPAWGGDNSIPVSAAYGFWLENKLWMLDQPGEWVFEGGKLYVWMPDGLSPANKLLYASTNVHAVAGYGVRNVTVRNLELLDARGDALAISGLNGGGAATNVVIDNVVAARAGGVGIKVIHNTNGSGLISNSTVTDSRSIGIYLGTDSTRSIHVTGNTVQNAGIGSFAAAAIWLGNKSNAINNIVSNSSYIGIKGAKLNFIERNVVSGSCKEFDDCGGIYVRGLDPADSESGHINAVSSQIHRNYVDGGLLAHSRDRIDGTPSSLTSPFSGTNGIYLDDFSGNVEILSNFVTGFDTGVMLHHGRDVSITGNRLVDNRRTQIYMQEDNYSGSRLDLSTDCAGLAGCNSQNYLMGNQVLGNVMVSKHVRPMIEHTSDFAGDADFARYASNQYAMPDAAQFAYLGQALKSFAQWRQTPVPNSTSVYQDADALFYNSAQGPTPLDAQANMVANGEFIQQGTNWQGWRTVTPTYGTAGCFDGACLTTSPGSDAQTVSGKKVFIVHTQSPMTVEQGKKYVVVFDAMSMAADDSVILNLTRVDNFATLSDYRGVTLGNRWKRHVVVLSSSPSTAGNGRLDFQFNANSTVRIDNVRMVAMPW